MTALIFVQMKQTASALTHILTCVAENNTALSFLRTDFAVGSQGGDSIIRSPRSPPQCHLTTRWRGEILKLITENERIGYSIAASLYNFTIVR